MIPAFLSLSEGLMAGLASRAHDWTFWSIGETFQKTPASTYCIHIELRVQLKKSGLRSLKLGPADSPSAVLQEIFRAEPSPGENFSGSAILSELPTSSPEYAPALAVFQQGRNEYRRQKNSRGELQEFGTAKN